MNSGWSNPTPRPAAQAKRFEPKPHNPDAHVITNVLLRDHCRRDRFCRCRRCKPPLRRAS